MMRAAGGRSLGGHAAALGRGEGFSRDSEDFWGRGWACEAADPGSCECNIMQQRGDKPSLDGKKIEK